MTTEDALVSLAIRLVNGPMPRTCLPATAVRFVDRNFHQWMSESNNVVQYERIARAAIRRFLG